MTDVPPGVGSGPNQSFAVAGRETAPGTWPAAVWRSVSDAHFRTLGIELLRGDDLEAGDATPRAVVVNETFVARFLPDGDLLGTRLHRVASPRAVSAEPDAWTIVGVVADVREEYAYRPVPPAVYARLDDQPPRSAAILVRATGSPLSLGPSVRDAVAAIDPDQAVYGIRDLPFMLNNEYDLNRLALAMLTLFAGTALLLSVAGIYGVVAHLVGQRLHEMGIRIALGAVHRDVVRLVVGDSARFAVAGAVVGLIAVATTGDRLAVLSHGWVGTEPVVLLTAACAVLFVAILAAYVPARRAMGVDPVEVMRRE
jgi:putative ABC transport system permease protein